MRYDDDNGKYGGDDGGGFTPKAETAEDIIKPIVAKIKESSANYLRCAPRIMALGDMWESTYKEGAKGLDYNAFLRSNFGRGCGYAFWERRARAVERFGRTDQLDHDAAVYMLHHVPAERDKEFMTAMRAGCRENGGNPLPYNSARAIIRAMLGKKPKKRIPNCAHCKACDAFIAEQGLDKAFVEWQATRD